jgi:translation initiation factor 3 subunit K
MTLFPSPQFDLALHLLSPNIANPAGSGPVSSELAEAVSKLRALNAQLEGGQYSRFWATMDSDDLYADLTTDIAGFEDVVRLRIAQLVSQSFREVKLDVLEAWLGISDEGEARKYVAEVCGWKVDAETGLVQIPRNPENEAKKAEIREDVNVDMFSRVIRRAWEEAA